MTTKTKSQEKNKMSEIDDQILKYFEIKKRLGKGAYGIVWKAFDKKSSQIVAVKKIFDAFRNETDAQRTFREIMFLRAFRNHPNVIQLHSIYKAANNLDIYLSFEFMESDLHNVIKRGTILKDVHKRYVMYQLFNAVKYIHSGNVIHRDLKPSNVLIDSKCRCKIADFGLARSVSHRQLGDSSTSVDVGEPILTDYVATRWYRAPEILVASKRYTKGIDMWSLGCILGEMIRGKPLFPGSSTVNQIEKIVSALPEVTEKDVAAVGSSFGSVLLNQQINSTSTTPKLDELLTGAPEDAKNLVKSLLILDPSGRLTAKQSLSHKYIEKFRHTIPEAELSSDVLPPFRDDVQLTVPEYRSKLYEIMQSTEKYSNGIKNVNKKKELNGNVKLDNSITVIPSTNPVNIVRKSAKHDDFEKRDNQFVKPFERRISTPQRNNSFTGSSAALGQGKCTKTTYTPKTHSSTPLSEAKFHAIPKVKYCKIPTMTDSKLNSATSEKADIQLNNKATHIQEKVNFSVDKRHSIDCGHIPGEVPLNFVHNLSAKNSIISNSSKVNDRGGRYGKVIKSEDTGTIPSTNKYLRKCFTPEESFRSGAHKGDGYLEKSPSIKISKAEILAMSNDSGSYYERRLKNLEEKIQRHKNDIKAMLNQSAKQKITKTDLEPKYKNVQATSSEKLSKIKVPLARSKSENSSSKKQGPPIKYDYTFPEGDRLSSKRRGSDYGVITAKGLIDLRKSQVIT